MADYSAYPDRIQCSRHELVKITVQQWNDSDSERCATIPVYVYFPDEAKNGADPWREMMCASWGRHPVTKAERFEIELISGRTIGYVEPSFPLYVHAAAAVEFGWTP